MSDELTAGAVAGAAQAEETKEQEMPGLEAVEESPGPAESEESEKAAEAFANWTGQAMPAETEAYARAEEARETGAPPEEEEVPGEPFIEMVVEIDAHVPEPGTPEIIDGHVEAAEAVEEDARQGELTGDEMRSVVFAASGTETENARIKALIEAVIYITDEPLSAQQIAQACGKPIGEVKQLLDELSEEYSREDRGLTIRELAGGYKMSTKPEHHEEIRAFVKNLKPPLKLSLAALETLAVIAYKQPITAPEIMEIRGVQGAGVLKTLLDRKLIATAGRKNVVGKPILYKSTRDFLVQFGLKDLSELPTLKEFEELGRLALTDAEADPAGHAAAAEPVPEAESMPEAEPEAPAVETVETEAGPPPPEPNA